MRSLLLLFLLSLFSLNGTGQSEPTFTYLGQPRNDLIVNRTPPEYGMGLPGGCEVKSEFAISIIEHANGVIEERIVERDTREEAFATTVLILYEDGSETEIESDFEGIFRIESSYGIVTLTFSCYNFRSIEISWNDLDE